MVDVEEDVPPPEAVPVVPLPVVPAVLPLVEPEVLGR